MRTNTRIFPRIFPRLFERDDSLVGMGLVDAAALIVFHAAWADAAGVNQTLLTGTGPVTTDHTSAIYALGSDGDYDAYTTDDPIWQYDADGDYLVAQDEGTNLLPYSTDLTNAAWAKANSPTVSYDQTGITGAANTASYIEDTGATAQYVTDGLTIIAGSETYTLRYRIKKDSDTSRFPFIGMQMGTVRSQWIINTSTGAYVGYTANDAAAEIDVEQVGDWWIICCSAANNGTATSHVTTVAPARGAAAFDGTLDNAETGSIILGNVECFKGLTIEQVKSLGPIFTSGAPATTSELRNVYPAVNHSNTEGPLYIEFENTGDDVVLLEAGTDEFLKIEDGTDGATYPEEVTNGDFATGDLTGWTQNQNWSVVDNKAVCNATGVRDFIYQNLLTSLYVTGKTFVLSYDVEITTGSLLLELGVAVYINGVITATISESTSGYKEYVLAFTGTGTTSNRPLIGSGTSNTVATIDNISIREADSKYLKLTDGTTQLQTACAVGEHKAGIAFSDEDSLMNLNLDDSWETQAAYDGTLGSGDISLGETSRNVKRWNETDFDKQKALIDKEMA